MPAFSGLAGDVSHRCLLMAHIAIETSLRLILPLPRAILYRSKLLVSIADI
jgi:hypothetical protein